MRFITLLVTVLSVASYGQSTISSYTGGGTNQALANNGTYYFMYGQSFQPSGTYVLDSAKVRLAKTSGATGDVRVEIYAHTGTFGSGGTPTGSALATSNTIDASTLTTTATWYKFTFSGGNRITLSSGTTYVVAIYYAGSAYTISTYRGTGQVGNAAGKVTTTWSAATYDMVHQVFGGPQSTTSIKAINGVTQATVSKVAGVTMSSGVKKFNGVANQ